MYFLSTWCKWYTIIYNYHLYPTKSKEQRDSSNSKQKIGAKQGQTEASETNVMVESAKNNKK